MANICCSIELEPRTLRQGQLNHARVRIIYLIIFSLLLYFSFLGQIKENKRRYSRLNCFEKHTKIVVQELLILVCLQEVAADVVQKLEPHEASTLFDEVSACLNSNKF